MPIVISMISIPEIINEGYVGTESKKYKWFLINGNRFDISDFLDRHQQIDKIWINTDLIKESHAIELQVGGQPIIQLPIKERYDTFKDTCEKDGWFDLFQIVDLRYMQFPQLRYHQVSIVPHLHDDFIRSHQSVRKEIEVQERYKTYVWDEGEEERLLPDDCHNDYDFDHRREERLDDEEVEIVIYKRWLPENMIRVEQSIPPEKRSPDIHHTRTNISTWVRECDFANWQKYNRRKIKLGEVSRCSDGYLKCPNIFGTDSGMGCLCYSWAD